MIRPQLGSRIFKLKLGKMKDRNKADIFLNRSILFNPKPSAESRVTGILLQIHLEQKCQVSLVELLATDWST